MGDHFERLYRLLKHVITELFTYIYTILYIYWRSYLNREFSVTPVSSFIANKTNYEFSFTSPFLVMKSWNTIYLLESAFLRILIIYR